MSTTDMLPPEKRTGIGRRRRPHRTLGRRRPALYKKSVIPGYASLYLRRAVVLCALLVGQLVLYGLTWVIGDAAISMMELILELARVQLILYT